MNSQLIRREVISTEVSSTVSLPSVHELVFLVRSTFRQEQSKSHNIALNLQFRASHAFVTGDADIACRFLDVSFFVHVIGEEVFFADRRA